MLIIFCNQDPEELCTMAKHLWHVVQMNPHVFLISVFNHVLLNVEMFLIRIGTI